MPSSIGTALRVTVFGQSHSQAVGCVIEGLPSGHGIDARRLAAFMARRAPGHASWSTPRKEADAIRILSGLNPDGRTCGAPLALIIENTNTRSSDYSMLRDVPRPGHADWTAQVKWHGEQDFAGGGHFSGRLTASLCAAGGIALQLLEGHGVRIAAHIFEIAGISDQGFAALGSSRRASALATQMDMLSDGRAFPVLDQDAGARMREAIDAAHAQADSVGGCIECVVTGLPAGIGSPMFDGIESTLARAIFGIPAVKGLEFGMGFGVAKLRGSQDNDPYEIVDGKVRPAKNYAGGNLGGITTGAPLLFRMAVKPTSSIGQEQRSVDLTTQREVPLRVKGRHDPCIVPRAVPVAEAVAALAVLDSWLAWPPDPPTDARFD
jgi:chorismate synthase